MPFGDFVQKRANGTGGAASPASLAYLSGVTAGSFLFAAVIWDQPTRDCSISDSVNGAWLPIGTKKIGTGGLANYPLQLFYLPSAASGMTTVTATLTGAGTCYLGILEYVGPATLHVFDGYVLDNTGPPSNSVQTNTITVTDAAAFMVAASLISSGTQTIDAPFTTRFSGAVDNTWGASGLADHKKDSGVADYFCQFNSASGGSATLGIVAFAPAAVGPVSRAATDNGLLSFSDSIQRTVVAARGSSDTALGSFGETAARALVASRGLSDSGLVSFSESVARVALKFRALSVAGVLFADAVQVHIPAVVLRSIVDTAALLLDALAPTGGFVRDPFQPEPFEFKILGHRAAIEPVSARAEFVIRPHRARVAILGDDIGSFKVGG
jgi:hypothetical protein